MASQNQIEPLWPADRPNFDRLRCILTRQEPPDRVPFIALFADLEIVAAVPMFGAPRKESM